MACVITGAMCSRRRQKGSRDLELSQIRGVNLDLDPYKLATINTNESAILDDCANHAVRSELESNPVANLEVGLGH